MLWPSRSPDRNLIDRIMFQNGDLSLQSRPTDSYHLWQNSLKPFWQLVGSQHLTETFYIVFSVICYPSVTPAHKCIILADFHLIFLTDYRN